MFQSLGNHELDEEIKGVTPFIRNLTAPVLAANLLLNEVPELERQKNLHKSISINIQGFDIGIIGYLTPDTKFLAPKNKIEYEDEVIAIRREVKKLKENGVKIFIALGHSGFIKDLEIAREVEDLDLVIGGHSNTFLSNDEQTKEKPEIPQGPYPTIVKQKSGRSVLVVQAYAYTKYMGKLHLNFDKNGNIVYFNGNPLLLTQDIPEDLEVLQKVNRYRQEVDLINNEVFGSSNVYLEGEQCRLRECNIGNFISDAMLNYTTLYYKEYSDVTIAIIQGGRIRTSINRDERPFQLTRGDWTTVMPYSDSLCVITMNGTVLRQALEHSISVWRKIDTPGQFLQVSGLEIIYDLAKKPGSRVISAKAVCSNCAELEDISESKIYKVIASTFLANGGDGYAVFEPLPKSILSYNEITCILDSLTKYSPIGPTIANRLTILNEPNSENQRKTTLSRATTKDLNYLLYFVLLSLLLYSS